MLAAWQKGVVGPMKTPDDIESAPRADQRPGRDGHSVDRRWFLRLAGGAVAGGVTASILSACSSSAARHASTTPSSTSPATTLPINGRAAFVDGTLPIPPLLAPQVQGGIKVFRLTAQQGQSQFLPGQTTETFGFNGSYLGPTLRAALGDRVLIHVTNSLGETTTVHWHGMHLPAAMDGGPHQMILADTTWSPQFTIQQPAATLWYHPHMLGQTLRQVGMGLVGFFILDDTDPAQDVLPHIYGRDDIPIVFQAKTFDANGEFVLNGGGGGGGGRGGRGGGAQGTTLVNGAISPAINTSDSQLRLRLLNASAQEFYDLGFADNTTFQQVASDGGLLTAPVALTRLQLAPAERAEIVFEVTPSAPMVLQNFGVGGGDNNSPTGPLLTINPKQPSPSSTRVPATLTTIERLSPGSAVQTRDFVLGGNDQNPTINGRAMTTMADMMDMSTMFQAKLDSTEIWNVINRSNDTHAFHVHDIQFQILQRDGAAPAANEAGRKDTVVVRPGETVRLIMRFTDFADPETPYMYHCHLLNHEDNGMMGHFLVV